MNTPQFIHLHNHTDESPPILWTVRKAATKADGGQSWYREERRTPASSRLKRLN